MKKWTITILICTVMMNLFFAFKVEAIVPYESYSYNYWGEKVSTPPAFVASKIISSDTAGTTVFNNPSDLYISRSGSVAMADTDNNRVLLLDENFKLQRVIDHIEVQSKASALKSPEGVFIDTDNELYICDTGNSRVIRFSAEGSVKQVYSKPQSPLLKDFSVYSPSKIVVDKSKKMYVICKGINMGILEIDESGVLDKFIGAPLVYVNPLDYFWKSIASREQAERMASYVPTEYNNISIDSKGFLFVTTDSVLEGQIISKIQSRDTSTKSAPVKRLTLNGEDILNRKGFFPPVGDLSFPVNNEDYAGKNDTGRSYLKETEKGPSALVDVVSSDSGIYSVLDAKRGRIFTYDDDGNLLFVFGGQGVQKGTFISPVSLCEMNGKYYVLDKVAGTITEFSRTSYGTEVLHAIQYYNNSDYDMALKTWKQVSLRDSNSEIAYLGIGKIYLMKNDYVNAMKYFKLANYRFYYSKALQLYKKEQLGKDVGIAVFIILAAGFVLVMVMKIRKAVLTVLHFGMPNAPEKIRKGE